MYKSALHIFSVKSLLLAATLLIYFHAESQSDENTVQESRVRYFDSVYVWSVPPVKSRKVDDSLLNDLKNDEAYWYANADLKKKAKTAEKNTSSGTSIFQQKWFRVLSWIIIIGGFIAIVIGYLASSNISLFRKRSTPIVDPSENDITENIFEINYERDIKKAIEAGDLRLAIRMHYLWILKEMDDKGIINYQYGKTNSDYLFQLAGTRYYKDFFRLTRLFDYTWYGHFNIAENNFARVQDDFLTFQKQIR